MLCGLLLTPTRTALAQFTIEELEMHVTARGLEPIVRLIPVRSDIDSTQQVRVTVKDWVRDSAGGNQTLDLGSHPRSCGGRLEVFPQTFQLGARATEYVRVTYTPASERDPGCWTIVLTETVRPPRPTMQLAASVIITTLTGVKVYVHAPDERAAGEVVSADVEVFREPRDRMRPTADSVTVRRVAVRFANTGTAHLVVKPTAEIRNERGDVVARLTGADAYITPDAFRDIELRLPSLARGRYVATVLLDFGASEITAAQVEFTVS